MENEFIDIYINELLKDIKKCVEKKINLEDTETLNRSTCRVEKVDEKMKMVLKDLFLTSNISMASSMDLELLKGAGKKKIKKKLKRYLVLYYTALYFDNVELLNTLLKNDFDFGKNPKDLFLCALDPEISSAFDDSKYLGILGRAYGVLEIFYNSIKDEPTSSRRKYIDKFSNIFKKREDIYFLDERYAFTKKAFDMIDEETYLMANDAQMYLISNLGTFEKKENIERLNRLMRERGFSNRFVDNGDILFNYFDDDELVNISLRNGIVLTNGIKAGADPARLKGLYNIENRLANYRIIYNETFLEKFDDETIASFPDGLLSYFSDVPFYYFPDNFDGIDESRLKNIMNRYGVKLNNTVGIKEKVKLLLGLKTGE